MGRCRVFGKRRACAETAEKWGCFAGGNAKRCRDDGKRKRNFSRKDAKAQRRPQGLRERLRLLCAFASLREKTCLVTLIEKDIQMASDIGFENEVIFLDRLPRGRAGVGAR